MEFILTVHGTGDSSQSRSVRRHYKEDGTETALEERWWQDGSAFLDELKGRLSGDAKSEIKILPFQWSGENDDQTRADAEDEFERFVREHTSRKDNIHVIAHSHGANVVLGALDKERIQSADPFSAYIALIRRLRRGLHISDRITSITTIGAPFLMVNPIKKRTAFVDRFGGLNGPRWIRSFGYTIIVIAWYLLGLLSTTLGRNDTFYNFFTADEYSDTRGLIITSFLAILIGTIFTGHFSLYFNKRSYNRYISALQKSGSDFRIVSRNIAEKVQIIFDRDDEAINSLRSAKNLDMKLGEGSNRQQKAIPSWTISLRRALLTLVTFVVFAFAYNFADERNYINESTPLYEIISPIASSTVDFSYTVEDNQEFPNEADTNPNNSDEPDLSDDTDDRNIPLIESLYFVTAKLILLFFISWIIASAGSYALHSFFRLSQPIFSWYSDKLISNRIITRAFGSRDVDDYLGVSRTTGIGEISERARLRWRELPDNISKIMHINANRHATETLARARSALGLLQLGVTSETALREISKTISWKELIHTSYFDISEIRSLIAYGIQRKRKGEAANREFDEETLTLYRAIAPDTDNPKRSVGRAQDMKLSRSHFFALDKP